MFTKREFYSGVSGVALGRLLKNTGLSASKLSESTRIDRKEVTAILGHNPPLFVSLNLADKLVMAASLVGALPSGRVDDFLIVVPSHQRGSSLRMAHDEWCARHGEENPPTPAWLKQRVMELDELRIAVLVSALPPPC